MIKSIFEGIQLSPLTGPFSHMRQVLIIVLLFMGVFPILAQNAPEPFRKSISNQGVVAELGIDHLNPDRPINRFREGDQVNISFRITDSTGTPLTALYPAAWMTRLHKSELDKPAACIKKVETFLSGNLFSKADLDLNAYYVLALNDDATISVVDPLFGFGGSKLLAMVPLESKGADWIMPENQNHLMVSMPDAGKLAVVNTADWKVKANLVIGKNPSELALQPDEHFLWVSYDGEAGVDSGVAAVAWQENKVSARIPTGAGPHALAISHDSRYAFVANAGSRTISVIDIRTLTKSTDITMNGKPSAIAYSQRARTLYAADELTGDVIAIDTRLHREIARAPGKPGVSQIALAPEERFLFIVNPLTDTVEVLDTASNRIIQSGVMDDQPYQVNFSDELAYVLHRGSEIVLMIPLVELGVEGKPLAVVDFPGGTLPPGKMTVQSQAPMLVQAPGENAVLLANAADKAIYFYREGMAAPMGSFKNYGRTPRAVAVVDRTLQEREKPGLYQTAVQLREPGFYDLVFFLDQPRFTHCFRLYIEADPQKEAVRRKETVRLTHLTKSKVLPVGKPSPLTFRLTGYGEDDFKTGLKDVRVTVMMTGNWHETLWAKEIGEGQYQADFTPPRAGYYYVYVGSRSIGLKRNNPHYLIVRAVEESPKPKLENLDGGDR